MTDHANADPGSTDGGDGAGDRLRDAWNEVGAGFSSLGETIAARFSRGATSTDTPTGPPPGSSGASAGAPPPPPPAPPPPTGDAELRAAFDRFVAAGRDLGDRLADVGHDDEVRTHARAATQKLDDALTATVDVITERLAGLVGRTERPEPGDDLPGSAER